MGEIFLHREVADALSVLLGPVLASASVFPLLQLCMSVGAMCSLGWGGVRVIHRESLFQFRS